MSAGRLRLRTATALVVLGAPLALAACSPAQAGAAAVVGPTRITETSLNTDATQVNAERATLHVQPVPGSALLPVLLQRRVDNTLVAGAAARLGVVVTPGQVDRFIAQYGGLATLQRQLAQQDATSTQAGAWVAPGRVNETVEVYLLEQGIGAKLAPGASSTVQGTATYAALQAEAHAVGVAVSPRYGTWSAKTLTIGPTPNDLSADAATLGLPAVPAG